MLPRLQEKWIFEKKPGWAYGDNDFMCPKDGWVMFRDSEVPDWTGFSQLIGHVANPCPVQLICGNLGKTVLGGSKSGLYYAIIRGRLCLLLTSAHFCPDADSTPGFNARRPLSCGGCALHEPPRQALGALDWHPRSVNNFPVVCLAWLSVGFLLALPSSVRG